MTKHSTGIDLISIAQEHINVVEAIFDRDREQLSCDEYEFYLRMVNEHRYLAVSRRSQIQEYIDNL